MSVLAEFFCGITFLLGILKCPQNELPPCRNETNFRCNNGSCIPTEAACDGKFDCSEQEDESDENCEDYYETTTRKIQRVILTTRRKFNGKIPKKPMSALKLKNDLLMKRTGKNCTTLEKLGKVVGCED